MPRAWSGVACLVCSLAVAACASETQADPTADGGGEDGGTNPDGDGGQNDGSSPGEDGGGGDADAAPQIPSIRYVGRFDTSDPAGPKVAWPGARVIVRFSGTEVKVKTTQT